MKIIIPMVLALLSMACTPDVIDTRPSPPDDLTERCHKRIDVLNAVAKCQVLKNRGLTNSGLYLKIVNVKGYSYRCTRILRAYDKGKYDQYNKGCI